jgi:spore coat protein U-like protein
MKNWKLVAALGMSLVGATASAQTANMAVSATIAGSCSVVANPLAFSVYDPTSATALNAQTTTVITCSTGAGASLSMAMGNNSTGTGSGAQRRMRVGASTNYLNYSIFQPSGSAEGAACDYGSPATWGNGTTGGAALAIGVAASPTPRTYNVCGQMPASQSSGVGSYTDSVTVTANL